MTAAEPEPSGRDLARVALHNARKAAKTAPPPDPRAARRQRNRARRTDGRDPMRLGAALTRLVDEHGWEAPAAGGSIIDQWPTIAPELVGKVAAVRFDAATGTLHLRPTAPAYGTQLRMFQRAMVDRINTATGRTVVRALHVLAPGPTTDHRNEPTAPAGEPAALEYPPPNQQPRTRDDAHPGYHHARAAIQRPGHTLDPAIRAARERQDHAQAREPETQFTDAIAARETAAAQATAGGNNREAIRQAAIQRARQERAGRAPAVTTLFNRTA